MKACKQLFAVDCCDLALLRLVFQSEVFQQPQTPTTMTFGRNPDSVMRFVSNIRSLGAYWVHTNEFPANIAEIIQFVLNAFRLLQRNMDSYTDTHILRIVAETYRLSETSYM